MRERAAKLHHLHQVVLIGMAAAAIIAALVVLPRHVNAQQSQLRQQIQSPDCTQPDECEMTPPTIETVSKNGGRPLFSGSYGAVFAQTLRVIFGGRVYELGVDAELTAQNDEWLLNLSNLSPPLAPGNYELIVETIDADGEVTRTTLTVVFTAADIDPGEDEEPVDPDDPTRPVPTAPDTGFLRSNSMPLVMLFVGVGSLIVLVAVLRRTDSKS